MCPCRLARNATFIILCALTPAAQASDPAFVTMHGGATGRVTGIQLSGYASRAGLAKAAGSPTAVATTAVAFLLENAARKLVVVR